MPTRNDSLCLGLPVFVRDVLFSPMAAFPTMLDGERQAEQTLGTRFTARAVARSEEGAILGFVVWFVFLVTFPPVVVQVFLECFSQESNLRDQWLNCLRNAFRYAFGHYV
ncbi:MAG: hypothetical protein WAU84_12000, partial [Thermoguttaceae bacterium]